MAASSASVSGSRLSSLTRDDDAEVFEALGARAVLSYLSRVGIEVIGRFQMVYTIMTVDLGKHNGFDVKNGFVHIYDTYFKLHCQKYDKIDGTKKISQGDYRDSILQANPYCDKYNGNQAQCEKHCLIFDEKRFAFETHNVFYLASKKSVVNLGDTSFYSEWADKNVECIWLLPVCGDKDVNVASSDKVYTLFDELDQVLDQDIAENISDEANDRATHYIIFEMVASSLEARLTQKLFELDKKIACYCLRFAKRHKPYRDKFAKMEKDEFMKDLFNIVENCIGLCGLVWRGNSDQKHLKSMIEHYRPFIPFLYKYWETRPLLIFQIAVSRPELKKIAIDSSPMRTRRLTDEFDELDELEMANKPLRQQMARIQEQMLQQIAQEKQQIAQEKQQIAQARQSIAQTQLLIAQTQLLIAQSRQSIAQSQQSIAQSQQSIAQSQQSIAQSVTIWVLGTIVAGLMLDRFFSRK